MWAATVEIETEAAHFPYRQIFRSYRMLYSKRALHGRFLPYEKYVPKALAFSILDVSY
jgi:hypothetical protein